MPVPVPRVVKPIAHTVIKNSSVGQTHPFQTFATTLPVSPTGPPPSFGTREEWINSLPSWRRTKPRRIWEEDCRLPEQDFHQGLVVADNAATLKGFRAEACFPPLGSGDQFHYAGAQDEIDDDMHSDCSLVNQEHYNGGTHWGCNPLIVDIGDAMDIEDLHAAETSPGLVFTDLATYESQTYQGGAYTPVFEDQSPGTASGPDISSSPLEPVTPFGDFVDRAVAADHQPYIYGGDSGGGITTTAQYVFQGKDLAALNFPTLAEPVKEPASTADVVTPSASTGYKKLAEPLSEWLANYVWKVCTTGLSLPSTFGCPSIGAIQYATSPPSYLSPSIHSLLLSTLLQPSAVILAIWYIVRLPVYFNATALGPDYVKESHFRAALLGDGQGFERETSQANAPFRLVVLGCMLANKWLDDHTFSNKTWHTISNVPIQILNKLESLSLDIFSYDLSISPRDWSQWLAHVRSYHMSLASSHLQPISRPSSNPHSIVRKAIDEIIQAPAACDPHSVPQPVFLGIEERKRERYEQEQAASIDALEIDLDEDGPLREEYLPRRRVSSSGKALGTRGNVGTSANTEYENLGHLDVQSERAKVLPPPAKWSPAGDEPILRDRNKSSGHYVAVQPPLSYTYPVAYQAHEVAYNQNWDPTLVVPLKGYPGYGYGHPSVPAHPSYQPFAHPPILPTSHSRSQSLFYDSDGLSSRNHLRTYSQSSFEYKCSDLRMTANELAPTVKAGHRWIDINHCPYPVASFVPIAVGLPSLWSRN